MACANAQAISFFLADEYPMLFRIFALSAWLLVAICRPTSAQPLWKPADIAATHDTLDAVVAKMHEANASLGLPSASRVDHFAIETGGVTIAADAHVRGDDYAITASLGDKPIAVGRSAGERWRKNSGGTVHLIRADVQGDDFDRWPVAELGFSLGDCTLLGDATVDRRPVWVLADRPALDIPRFLYVDRETGDIVREISREGTRVEQYDFTDVRGDASARRAYAWTVTGDGAKAHVTLVSSEPAPVTESDVAVPTQGPSEFSEPVAARKLSATIIGFRIMVDLRVAGQRRIFQLDSGTPEMIINTSISKPLGPTVLNHTAISQLDVDGSVGTSVPAIQTPFFDDGLLGYDFFRGKIVHVDYVHGRVDILPRTGFAPPADATPLPTDWREGMPIVTASIGGWTGERFVLDLGSPRLVLARGFLERTGLATDIDASARPLLMPYLEGGVTVTAVDLSSFALGGTTLHDLPANAELARADNLAIPLDGIIGSDVLDHFEWWFDADGPVTWFRPAPR
jgi:hypothetical protein